MPKTCTCLGEINKLEYEYVLLFSQQIQNFYFFQITPKRLLQLTVTKNMLILLVESFLVVGSWDFDLQLYLELYFDNIIYLSLSVCLSIFLSVFLWLPVQNILILLALGFYIVVILKTKQIYSPTPRASYLCLLSLPQIYFAVHHTYCSE